MAEEKNLRIFNHESHSISFEDALKSGFRQAAHCCFYSPHPYHLFKKYESKAFVSMQLRFDGTFGFPGGFINQGEEILDGLNRELVEEINLNAKYFVTQKDYIYSHVGENKACLHSYAKRVSPEEFAEIEKSAINARDYGKEVMGIIRVPLCCFDDGFRGFPSFLSNKFVAHSKFQLLDILVAANIMSVEEIEKALNKSNS